MDNGSDEIVVSAWTPRFASAVDKLLKTEGGFVDDPADRGGATKYGISLRFLVTEGAFDEDGDGNAEFDLDMDGDIDGADIRRLTRINAKALYHRCFWQRLDAEGFPRPIGEMLFDQAVNGGALAARKLLQRAINFCLVKASTSTARPAFLATDGKIGVVTRAALDFVLTCPAVGMPALVEAYRRAAADRYREIALRNPSQKRFLNGWLARAWELGR